MYALIAFFFQLSSYQSKILPFDVYFVTPNSQKELTVYEGGYFNDLFDKNTFPP